MGKMVNCFLKEEIKEVAGPRQVCAGHNAGAEATVHANTFISPSRLFICSRGEIPSQEGTTQGDPLAMPWYSVNTCIMIQSGKIFISSRGLGQAIGSERYGLGNDSKEYLQCKKAMNDKIAKAAGLLRRASDMLLTVDSPSTSVLSEGSMESQSMLQSVAESVN